MFMLVFVDWECAVASIVEKKKTLVRWGEG